MKTLRTRRSKVLAGLKGPQHAAATAAMIQWAHDDEMSHTLNLCDASIHETATSPGDHGVAWSLLFPVSAASPSGPG